MPLMNEGGLDKGGGGQQTGKSYSFSAYEADAGLSITDVANICRGRVPFFLLHEAQGKDNMKHVYVLTLGVVQWLEEQGWDRTILPWPSGIGGQIEP